MRRYFLFLFPEETRVQELLDLAIYVLNPDEKWQAHVTLAGPYTDPRRLPNETEFHRKISTLGVGEFRSEVQNTIFLEIKAKDLEEFWDKPDFPFRPHLTIYDGNDAELANRLYERLFEIRMFFSFHVSRIYVVSSVKGQSSLDLISKVNMSAIPELRGIDISAARRFSIDEKLFYATAALRRAKSYAHGFQLFAS